MNDFSPLIIVLFGVLVLTIVGLIILLVKRNNQPDDKLLSTMLEQFNQQNRQFEETRNVTQEQLAKTREQTQVELAKTREQTQEELAKTRETTQAELTKTREQTQEELAKTREQTQMALDVHREKTQQSIIASARQSERLSIQAQKTIADITEQMTRLVQTSSKQATEFQQFQKIFSNPKQRGSLGEYLLGNLLDNFLPANLWEAQFQIGDRGNVDAVVKVEGKLLPIDSKFPLDDYLRWVELDANNPEKVIVEGRLYDGIRKRIEETAKYIAPKFGTMDFAFMYIPSEPLFFDILDRKILKKGANVTNLIEWAARERKVHLVSPTTLLTYLQSIMQGLKAVQIEQHADEIRKKLSKLFDYLKRHYDEIIALGKSLTAAQNHYDKVEKSLSQVGTTVNQITGQTTALDDDETTIAEIIPDESESNSPNAHLS